MLSSVNIFKTCSSVITPVETNAQPPWTRAGCSNGFKGPPYAACFLNRAQVTGRTVAASLHAGTSLLHEGDVPVLEISACNLCNTNVDMQDSSTRETLPPQSPDGHTADTILRTALQRFRLNALVDNSVRVFCALLLWLVLLIGACDA